MYVPPFKKNEYIPCLFLGITHKQLNAKLLFYFITTTTLASVSQVLKINNCSGCTLDNNAYGVCFQMG